MAAAYAWLIYHASHTNSNIEVCFIKNVSGFPCLSCGITRSVLLCFHGDVVAAFMLNPLGIAAALVLVSLPAWLLLDLLYKKQTFVHVVSVADRMLRRRYVYVPLIIIGALNWYWNILKGL